MSLRARKRESESGSSAGMSLWFYICVCYSYLYLVSVSVVSHKPSHKQGGVTLIGSVLQAATAVKISLTDFDRKIYDSITLLTFTIVGFIAENMLDP